MQDRRLWRARCRDGGPTGVVAVTLVEVVVEPVGSRGPHHLRHRLGDRAKAGFALAPLQRRLGQETRLVLELLDLVPDQVLPTARCESPLDGAHQRLLPERTFEHHPVAQSARQGRSGRERTPDLTRRRAQVDERQVRPGRLLAELVEQVLRGTAHQCLLGDDDEAGLRADAFGELVDAEAHARGMTALREQVAEALRIAPERCDDQRFGRCDLRIIRHRRAPPSAAPSTRRTPACP